MTERERLILQGFRDAGEGATALPAGTIGRRFLRLTGRRPDRSALDVLRRMQRKRWVGTITAPWGQHRRARLWYVTEVGSLALDGVLQERAA